MTICYFTASGNCLYVARRIGGELLSIPKLMRQDEISIEDDVNAVQMVDNFIPYFDMQEQTIPQ